MRGLSIKFTQGPLMGKRDQWNDALKYMLVNLKVMLHWVMKDQSLAAGQTPSEVVREMGPDMAASMTGPPRRGGGASTIFDGARSMFNVQGR